MPQDATMIVGWFIPTLGMVPRPGVPWGVPLGFETMLYKAKSSWYEHQFLSFGVL